MKDKETITLDDIDVDALAAEIETIDLPLEHVLAGLERQLNSVLVQLTDIGLSIKISRVFGEKQRIQQLEENAKPLEEKRRLLEALKERLNGGPRTGATGDGG